MSRAVSLLVVVTAFACACGTSTTAPTETPPPTVTALTISGPPPAIGASSQLTATATMSDGSAQDVTARASWHSSNTSVVIVGSSGLAFGVAAGEADLQASFSGTNGSLHLALGSPTLTVAGIITDIESGQAIDGEVEIIDGPNAGRKVRADDTGHYSLDGLAAGSLTVRARAAGYNSIDRHLTIVDRDVRADITLRRAAPDYSGTWDGDYTIDACTNVDPPGSTSIDICAIAATSNIYRFTLSQSGQTVTGTYRMVSPMFSCPCGGDYGTFDISGTVAADGTLTMITTGTPRGSGVVLAETFNVRMTSGTTITGALTGTFSLSDAVRGTFSGSVRLGTR